MSEIENVSLVNLAPFYKGTDEEKGDYIFQLHNDVLARLTDPRFNNEANPDSVPTFVQMMLISSTRDKGSVELTEDELVAKEFGHPEPNAVWRKTVEDIISKKKKTVVSKSSVFDQYAESNSRLMRNDDWFTVRVDNLPNGCGKDALETLLREQGCNYFSYIIVPRNDDDTFKRFGFVKFKHLRYAIMFCDEYRTIRVGDMIINTALTA